LSLFAGRVILEIDSERVPVRVSDDVPHCQLRIRTDRGGGTRRDGTSGSGYFQTALAKLIDRLSTRVRFTLGVHGGLGRQIAELIADVPAALAAI
jgi:hypothetical protein